LHECYENSDHFDVVEAPVSSNPPPEPSVRWTPRLASPTNLPPSCGEVGHYLLHFGERCSETTKRVRETEAEAVAFVVSEATGLGAMRSSSEYVSLYSGDKDLLTEFLEHIQRASAEIITAITSPG